MILNTQINIKHFYRFIEYTSKMLKKNQTHERYKLISLDNYSCQTKEEESIKSFSDAYLYLLSNLNQVMKVEILNNGYFLLTGKELEKEIAEQILKEYYLNIDTDVYKHSALVHLAVLDNVKERKFEFAFMISNYIIAKRNGGMMIPYLGIHKTYYQTIKDRNLKKLMYIFANIENKPRYELHDKILTREEVIDKILAEKQILKEKYNVKKLYLYGSYAKNMINEKSDIDLLIVFEKEYINIENEIKKEEVKSFLKERLERVVDIIIFETALTNLEINEMEKIITII